MERRLTTVLAADIVGYSALMDHDREGTLAALRAFREKILKSTFAVHKGRLIKSMGDGWIAEFQSTSDLVGESMHLAFVFKAAADAYNAQLNQ